METEILTHLQGTGEATLRDIQEAVDSDIAAVFAHCQELERTQQIRRVRPFTYQYNKQPQTPAADTNPSHPRPTHEPTTHPDGDGATDATESDGFLWGEDR